MSSTPEWQKKNKKPLKLNWTAKELQHIGSGVIKPHMKVKDILQKPIDDFQKGHGPIWVPYFKRFVTIWRKRNKEQDMVNETTFSQYKNATTFGEIKHYPLDQYVHQIITWLNLKARDPKNPALPPKMKQTGAKYFVRWYSLVMAREKELSNYEGDPDKVLVTLSRSEAANYYPIADEYIKAPTPSLKRKRSYGSHSAIRHLRHFSDVDQKATECKNVFMKKIQENGIELEKVIKDMEKLRNMDHKLAYLQKFLGDILEEYNAQVKESNETDIINSIYDLNGRKSLVMSQIRCNHPTLDAYEEAGASSQ